MKEVKQPDKRRPMAWFMLAAVFVLLMVNSVILPARNNVKVTETDYGTFLDMLDEGKLTRVDIDSSTIYFTDTEENNWSATALNDPSLVERLHEAGVEFANIYSPPSKLQSLLYGWVVPLLFLALVWLVLGRILAKKMGGNGGGVASMMFGAQSGAKMYVADQPGVKFADVAGQEEAKENLQEVVDFLHNPHKYEQAGARMPKGVLLVGPPGTGKTLLAKAVAGEASVPFFSIAGSEFVEMFVGMGAAKVRDLFKQANEKAPCIIFIDELETVGKKRDGGGLGGNDEREQTLNQLLTEMDGFDGSAGVMILAATNRPETLDPALLRPGRFDRRVPVELPDLRGREAILRLHAQKVKLEEHCDLAAIARMSPGASGAELANMINEAALTAVRNGRTLIYQADLEESVEVVIAGYQKKNAIITEKEKAIVAYHEIGHALVAAFQSHSAPVQKITIIPRTSGALGYTMQVEETEHYLMSREELENKIATYCGGRAAEQLAFNSVTTGASNDIEQATRIARSMITRFGMSDSFGMVALETLTNQYLGGDTSLACSMDTAAQIDREVVALVARQYDKAASILRDNRAKLDELAKYLFEKETITGIEFMDILNRKPLLSPPADDPQE